MRAGMAAFNGSKGAAMLILCFGREVQIRTADVSKERLMNEWMRLFNSVLWFGAVPNFLRTGHMLST